MLTPSTFPEWLPPAVALEAKRLLSAETADAALVLRLATHERMKLVWRDLSRVSKGRDASLGEAWAIMRDHLEVDPPDSSDPLVLFFWLAYITSGAKAGTIHDLDLPIASYQTEASCLQFAAANLRKLKLKYGGEIVEAGWKFHDIHCKDIERAAAFCDEIIDTLKKLRALSAPVIVKRDVGNREARGYVRMLAVETRKLFGKGVLGNRHLAKVASVVLKKNITEFQVRKWCDRLSDG
jgi:hypothetical protein